MSVRVLLFSLFVSMGACGGRPAGQADVGGPGLPGDGAIPAADGPGGNTGACVVAVKHDTCCPQALPVATSQLQADPCLIPYSSQTKVPQICLERRAQLFCTEVACPAPQPKTLFAMRGADGKCTWKSECSTDAECVVVEDCRSGCCTCATVLPKSFAEQEPCILFPPKTYPLPGCAQRCPDMCWPPRQIPPPACLPVEGAPGLNRCGQSTSPSGYVLWQQPGGFAGHGPALEIDGVQLRAWKQIPTQQPHQITIKPDFELKLEAKLAASFFSQLAAVNFSALPHHVAPDWECYPSFYYEKCASCAPVKLAYGAGADLLPELQAVYALFPSMLPEGVVWPSWYCMLD